MNDELLTGFAKLSPEHSAQIAALVEEWARVDTEEREILEARITVAAALAKQTLGVPVMWAEDDQTEVWVTRSEGGHTVEYRPKPGSPVALRIELTRQAEQARVVLRDPKANGKQLTEALRIAGLAALEGITIAG